MVSHLRRPRYPQHPAIEYTTKIANIDMAYVAVFLYIVTIVTTAGATSLAVDGVIPSLGFNAVMYSLVMIPEHFWMIPHYANASDIAERELPLTFRLGLSPSSTVFAFACAFGLLHTLVTFFLFRTFTTKLEWAIPNVICGLIAFVLIIVIGMMIGQSVAFADRDIETTTVTPDPRKMRRKK
ncbi:hypothetical protein SH528x_002943 [Novipirellula sp. SH528]|uniref:hypothetical protein n=1 Tax=Novipirellula sp. SH528 TaxID=3454466 RepID=UPI003FA115CF